MAYRKHRSIRKLIASRLPDIAQIAENLTSRSLDQQPEYFISLKTAEAIHENFNSYIFSMEVRLEDVCLDAGIPISEFPKEYRINGLKRADLVIRHSKNGRFRHVIEFKKGVKVSSILDDARRLAWLCQNVHFGHKMEKNFLVTVTRYGENVLKKKTKIINDMLKNSFPLVELTDEYVSLEKFKSTKPSLHGKPLHAMVWEFQYRDA